MTLVMLNGDLVEADKAFLPITDRAVTHGLGLFETLKMIGGYPAFFDEHMDRLEDGLGELGLPHPCTREEMADQIRRLSLAEQIPNGACRVLVSAGAPQGPPALLIGVEVRVFPDRPLNVISYRGTRVRAQLKAMSMMQSHLALRAAKEAHVDDAILVDEDGHIFEGSTSNMFLVRGGGLVTPPADGAILPGVLRAKIEQLAEQHGIPVVEALVRVADLRPDDGMLLTSSVRGIVVVASVDGLRLRTDLPIHSQLCSLVGTAEAASVLTFRATYG